MHNRATTPTSQRYIGGLSAALDGCFPTDIFLSQCGVRGVAGRGGPPGTIMTNSRCLSLGVGKMILLPILKNYANKKV